MSSQVAVTNGLMSLRYPNFGVLRDLLIAGSIAHMHTAKKYTVNWHRRIIGHMWKLKEALGLRREEHIRAAPACISRRTIEGFGYRRAGTASAR